MSIIQKLHWKISREHHALQKSLHELKSLGIEITNRCNLQCQHCYMSSVRQGRGELATTQWLAFFDQLKKDFGNKLLIQITGGEPLIREDLFELLTHLKNLGFRTTIVTNGVLLNKAMALKLKELVPSVSVSLDGFEDSHDYLRGAAIFKTVVDNIRSAKALGIERLAVKTTVYKKNLSQLRDFYAFLQQLGIDGWHLFAMEPIGRGRQNREDVLSLEGYLRLCEFFDEIKKDRHQKMRLTFEEQGSGFRHKKACEHCHFKLCGAGISYCAVLYNGDVVNCIQDDRTRLEVHGNITREPLKKIWDEKFTSHRQKGYNYCDNHYFLNKLAGKP